jgi:hypothetical protein
LDAFGQATQAAQAQGNVASQQARELLPLAKYQQTGGLDALQKYSDVIGSMAKTMPTTSTVTKQGSALENIQKIGSFLGQAGLTADKIASGSTGIPWFDRMVRGTNPDMTVVTPEQAAADQAQLQNWLKQYELNADDLTEWGSGLGG